MVECIYRRRVHLFNQLLALRIMDKALNLPGDVVDKDRLMLSLFGDGTSPEAGVPLDYLESHGNVSRARFGVGKEQDCYCHTGQWYASLSRCNGLGKRITCVTLSYRQEFYYQLGSRINGVQSRTHEYSDSE